MVNTIIKCYKSLQTIYGGIKATKKIIEKARIKMKNKKKNTNNIQNGKIKKYIYTYPKLFLPHI